MTDEPTPGTRPAEVTRDAAEGSTEVRVVLMTAPDRATGVSIARKVVEERLAACGNVLPEVTSIYRWDGEIQHDAEVLLVLKSASQRIPALIDRIAELHPYDVPEVLALPVVRGHGPYIDWVLNECLADG